MINKFMLINLAGHTAAVSISGPNSILFPLDQLHSFSVSGPSPVMWPANACSFYPTPRMYFILPTPDPSISSVYLFIFHLQHKPHRSCTEPVATEIPCC